MKVLFANEYYNGKINEKGYIHKMIMEYFFTLQLYNHR